MKTNNIFFNYKENLKSLFNILEILTFSLTIIFVGYFTLIIKPEIDFFIYFFVITMIVYAPSFYVNSFVKLRKRYSVYWILNSLRIFKLTLLYNE